MSTTIPGTTYPSTKEGWEMLYRGVSSMSAESCERILDANNIPNGSLVLFEYRQEVAELCLRNGVSRYCW